MAVLNSDILAGLEKYLTNTGPMGPTIPDYLNTKQPSWFDTFKKDYLGTKEDPGIVPIGLSLGQNILSGILGWQQLGMAKDALASSKDQFNKNYETQRKLVNRQIDTSARNKAAFLGKDQEMAAAEEMKKWGV